MIHSALYLNVRHDFFRGCVFIVANAFLCNFLPEACRLKRHPRARYLYEVLIHLMAGFALNWRVRIPSLDQEFLGFKRTFRHNYRNWRETRSMKGSTAWRQSNRLRR